MSSQNCWLFLTLSIFLKDKRPTNLKKKPKLKQQQQIPCEDKEEQVQS